MEKERLDQILLRMGLAKEEQIIRALQHQRTHGGRMGSHLVYLGFIGEAELVHALCEQHKVPGFFLDEHRISTPTVKKIPPEVAEKYQILPFAFDKASKTLSLAAVDPGNPEMVSTVKEVFRAKKVDIYVSSESLIRLLITHYYRGKEEHSEKTEGKAASKRKRRMKKVGKAKSSAPKKSNDGGFSGSLSVLSFIDLLQALAQGAKTVHVSLSGPDGESGHVYLRRGKMVHAECGRVGGVGAIYRIIEWGEDGSFSVESTDQFPTDNIFDTNEAILMEGCRLMDEAAYDHSSS
jgi:hypothetical protein